MCELLVGLPDVNVLAVTDNSETLRVTVETRQDRPACRACCGPVKFRDRNDVEHADLPCFGRRALLVWRTARIVLSVVAQAPIVSWRLAAFDAAFYDSFGRSCRVGGK